MICPWCHFSNLSRAKACGQCGLSLNCGVECKRCSTLNPNSYRFCDTCGAALPLTSEVSPSSDDSVASSRSCTATNSRLTPLSNIRFQKLLKLPKPGLVWLQPVPQWRWSWSHLTAWIILNKYELSFVVILTIIAGVLRIYRVSDIPGGLHGDEALTGLDALRILREGWIGPYVGSALGQPTGPLYFTALIFVISKPTVFTLHLSMALLGIATIPASYFLFRFSFGRWVALFGTVALTFSYWHIFFSRSGFMLISMPLVTTLAAAALVVSVRSKKRWTWFVAGIILGLGAYSYNGYVVFLAVAGVFLATVMVLGRENLRHYVRGSALLGLGFLISAFPLIQLAVSDPEFFFQHHRFASFVQDPTYIDARTLGSKIGFFAERVWDAATVPLRHPEIDYVDGLGGRGTLDPILGLLAYAGLIISVAKWRSPPHLLMALSFVLGLCGIVLGVENVGELRRTFVVVPFVYGLAGIAAIEGGKWLARSFGKPRGELVAGAVVAVILVVAVAINTWTYFGKIVNEDHIKWVYAADLVDALHLAHMPEQPGIIYFYSGRWTYDYDSRKFLYPDTEGVDRSREFGDYSLERLDDGPVTYVLLPPYVSEIDALRNLYPGGDTKHSYARDGNSRFAIYRLP